LPDLDCGPHAAGDVVPRRSTGFSDLKQAEAVRASLVSQAKDEAARGPTVAEYAEKYLAFRRHELGEKTIGQHRLPLYHLTKVCKERRAPYMRMLTVDLLETFKTEGLPANMATHRRRRRSRSSAPLRTAYRRKEFYMVTTATMSEAAFDRPQYEEGRKRELVQREPIAAPGATLKHPLIVLQLGTSLHQYFWRELRGCAAPDVGEDNRLRPDVAILLGHHWTSVDEDKTPIPLVPDIAVEVQSPSEGANDTMHKIRTYLGAGVREVWQVAPEFQTVLIDRGTKSITVLEIGDSLNTPLLPGWEIPVREIFNTKRQP